MAIFAAVNWCTERAKLMPDVTNSAFYLIRLLAKRSLCAGPKTERHIMHCSRAHGPFLNGLGLGYVVSENTAGVSIECS